MIDGLRADLLYALRALTRRPLFATTIVATLAIAIGAGTALFSVVNGVLLKPLPYAEADRLVAVRGTDQVNGLLDSNLSPPDVADFRTSMRTLDGVAAYSVASSVLTGGGDPASVRVGMVTGGFFEILKARPELGREFLPEEEQRGRHRVVLLSQGLWRARFGADPGIVGKPVQLGGVDYSVVGVLPAGFTGPQPQAFENPDLWRPIPIDPDGRGGHWMKGIARMKDGVTLQQAQAELAAVAAGLERDHPDTNTGRQARLVPLQDSIVAGARPALAALMGAVLFLVLIAGANVAGLLLARAHERRREAAVRAALGAGRARVIRLVLTESLVLALLGGAAGVLVALWGTDLIIALCGWGAGHMAIPRAEEIRLDGRVLGFALLLSCAVGVLAGLAPALRLSRSGWSQALKEGPGAGGAPGGRRLRELLVVAQMALSLMLLIGAGLMAGSLERLLRVSPGFRTENVLTLEIDLPGSRYPDDARVLAFYDRLLERVTTLPGVRAAGVVNIAPLTGSSSCDGFEIPDHAPISPGQEPCAEARVGTPGYLDAIGIPIRRGRGFTGADVAGAAPVALVNEAFAKRFFPREDPLGRHLDAGTGPRSIVGVIGDIRHFSLAQEASPEFYLPQAQQPNPDMILAVSTNGDATALLPAVRREVQNLDAALALDRVHTVEELLSGSASQPRFRAVLLGTFAIAALLLAAVGLYGLMAHSVGQRLHEIGIRMALGACRREILRLVLGQGLRIVAIGVAIGLAGALLVAPLLSGLLFGVSATDPLTFATLAAVLSAIAMVACFVPAARAARVDPMRVLRSE